jgi:hypothetical protein
MWRSMQLSEPILAPDISLGVRNFVSHNEVKSNLNAKNRFIQISVRIV